MVGARTGCLVLVEAAAAAMVVGVWGAWAEVNGASVPGTDAGSRGWVVLVAALVAAGVALFRRATRSAGVWALLCGIAGVAAAAYDRSHVAEIIGASSVVRAAATSGWGLDLAFAGSLALVVGGAAWLLLLTTLPWSWLEPTGDGPR